MIASHFGTESVVIIGSQAILVSDPEAPFDMCTSMEIDASPADADRWEAIHPGAEASEEINALFGQDSGFHRSFGFYIDGVDKRTAHLPSDWHRRRIERPVDVDGRTVTAVAPDPLDLLVSKLARLDPKDKRWARTYRHHYGIDVAELGRRLDRTDIEAEKRRLIDQFIAGTGETG